MWKVEVQCPECQSTHELHAQLDVMPRAFSYVCPETEGSVEIRYRDPSVQPHPWSEAEEPSPGSIAVSTADTGGSLEI